MKQITPDILNYYFRASVVCPREMSYRVHRFDIKMTKDQQIVAVPEPIGGRDRVDNPEPYTHASYLCRLYPHS